MQQQIENEMIMASAGSGKTYTLGVRLIRLLALGVAAEKIVALTFTRKAAAEFLDVVLQRLATAADDADQAARLAQEIGLPAFDSAAALTILTQLTQLLHRLNLTTIDSFFSRIVRCFPYELGISGDFKILDPAEAKSTREQVLLHVLTLSTADTRSAFMEAFKRSTFGSSGKRMWQDLTTFLRDYHNLLLTYPDPGFWGSPDRIWPQGYPYPSADSLALTAAVARFVDSFDPASLTDKQQQRLDAFQAAALNWQPGTPPPKDADYILKKALEYLQEPDGVLTLERKKTPLSEGGAAALILIAHLWIGGEIERVLQRTQGIYQLLVLIEQVYSQRVRQQGMLTFSDLPVLIRQALTQSSPLSTGNISYRLDSTVEHWLLDEFQDTSTLQWDVLGIFVDEALQDSEGRKSLFYVGDVKQAIYGWRGGDPSLFGRIYRHYNQGSVQRIQRRDLLSTWRCRPAIIELTNTVLGDSAVLEELLPGAGSQRWNQQWQPHTSACTDHDGHAAVLLCADEADRYHQTVELIRNLDPIHSGLSCAILTQTNKTAQAITDYLRAENIPALRDGTLKPGSDNLPGLLIRALVSAVAHPQDALSANYLTLTPLRSLLDSETQQKQLFNRFRSLVAEKGFAPAITDLLEQVDSCHPLDAFNWQRAEIILDAARLFDESGRNGYQNFLTLLDELETPETAGSNAIQVLTIHRSKGLGFDIVILPDLEGQTLLQARSAELSIQSNQPPPWGLFLPAKHIASADPVLNRQYEQAVADQCYESLCLLYVAFTRAKHGLYALIDQRKSSSANFPAILTHTLGTTEQSAQIGSLQARLIANFGQERWQTVPASPLAPTPSTSASAPFQTAGALPAFASRQRISPSEDAGQTLPAEQVFSPARQQRKELGQALHQLLEGIVSSADFATLSASTLPQQHASSAQAFDLLRSAFAQPEFAALFPTPSEHCQVWVEKPFEVLLDDRWVSGIFDRVLIHQQGSVITAVTVIDFKTATPATLPDSWLAQVQLYRQALALLLQLPIAKINATIAMLDPVKVHPVPNHSYSTDHI